MNEQKITLPMVERNGVLQVLPMPTMSSIYRDKPKTDSKPKPTQGAFEDTLHNSDNWANWGAGDNIPTVLRKKIKSSPIAGQAVLRIVKMLYGNGICYYDNKAFEQTGEMKRVIRPKIERFLRINRIQTHFLLSQFTDWAQFSNAFSELIFSNDFTKITHIYHKSAIFSRLELQNEKSFKIDHLYYSPQFAEDYPDNNQIKKIPLYDWTEPLEFIERLKTRKFAWHTKWPGQDPYYAEPFHIGLAQEDGWLDINRKIPQIINAMMDNQITLKYLIHIPVSFYKLRFPGFNDEDAKGQKKIIDDHIATINEKLQGVDKVFSSIAGLFEDDNVGTTGNQGVGKIEVISVDDKLKRDAWVPSAEHSNYQIAQGFGVHPSQIGLAPESGKMGAGSGSDQRESFNTAVQLNTPEQMLLYEPLNWIATYNQQLDPEWDVTFFADHSTHTTTNNVETGVVPGQNAPGQNQIQ